MLKIIGIREDIAQWAVESWAIALEVIKKDKLTTVNQSSFKEAVVKETESKKNIIDQQIAKEYFNDKDLRVE